MLTNCNRKRRRYKYKRRCRFQTPGQYQTYKGKLYDQTGLINMGARYYDPETSEFLSPDPYGYTGTTNLYTYANADPINFYDPDGRLFQPALQAIGAVVPKSAHSYGSIEEYNQVHRSTQMAFESQYYGTQIPSLKNKLQKPWVPFYASYKAKQYLGVNPYIAGTTPIAADVISGVGKARDLSRFAGKFPNVVKNIAENRAALKSSQYSKFLAKSFYLEHGYDIKSTMDHLRGIDFSKPVQIATIRKGAIRIQYRLPGSPQGSYYALLNSDKAKLGIYTSGRQPHRYRAQTDMHVLRSYAKPMIDDYSMRTYGWRILTNGGEIQEFTPVKHFFNYVK